jgi:hypothetical protein
LKDKKINLALLWSKYSGGVLRLSVPDFDKLIDVYNASGKSMESITNRLMGGQDHQYNIHYSVFNYRRLSDLHFNNARFLHAPFFLENVCRLQYLYAVLTPIKCIYK